MSNALQSRIQRRTLLKTAPAAGLATLMRPEGSLGADAVRFAFFADPSEALAYAQLIDRFEASLREQLARSQPGSAPTRTVYRRAAAASDADDDAYEHEDDHEDAGRDD